jgi:hypothetical protein
LKKFQVRLTCAWSLLNDFYSLRKCSSQVWQSKLVHFENFNRL